MDHGKRRGTYRLTAEAEQIDLGNEPPLSVDGEQGHLVDRRRVSVQWFSGTILTGLCGAALMGGAVFASLDGETNFATVPERIELALRGAVGGAGDRSAASARKADRLPPASEFNSLRRVVRETRTSRVGSREEENFAVLETQFGQLSLPRTSVPSLIYADVTIDEYFGESQARNV